MAAKVTSIMMKKKAASRIRLRTGTQVFVRKYDTEPYGINAGGIIKARKDAKKKKAKDMLENY